MPRITTMGVEDTYPTSASSRHPAIALLPVSYTLRLESSHGTSCSALSQLAWAH
jgi:hypothetical protein